MEINKLICDRCGKSAETALERTGWNQLVVDAVPGGLLPLTSATRLHVCTSCTSELRQFVPAEHRDAFSTRHMRHEETIDFVFKEVVRVATGVTSELTERRDGGFKIRRLALLVARPDDWIVEQIYVGNRNQLVSTRGNYYTIGGAEIADRKLDDEIEAVSDMMDLRIVTTYIGKNPEGAEWKGVRVTAIVPGAEPSKAHAR
jgi:hypothetical protein